jgi:Outer membrane protein beta-barrel domain
MRKAMSLGVVALAGLLASPAFADEFTGFRIGIGMSSDKLDGFYTDTTVAPDTTTQKSDSQRFGYSIFGGWALNKYLAFEGGLNGGTKFNKEMFPAFVATIDPSTDPAETDGNEFYKVEQDVKSVQLSAVGSWWFNNKVSVFGRLGGIAWRGRVAYSWGDAVPPVTDPLTPPFKFTDHATDNGFAPLFGGGIQTQLDHALVRFEYFQAEIDDLAFGPNFASSDNTYSSLQFSIVWTL